MEIISSQKIWDNEISENSVLWRIVTILEKEVSKKLQIQSALDIKENFDCVQCAVSLVKV